MASHPIPDSKRTSSGGKESSANSMMGQREDDSVLVMRTRRGEREAFALLYDRYSRLVYSVALRVVRNASTAEDILHDVFLQLWQAPERFDSSRGNLPSWMAVIARNTIDTWCESFLASLEETAPIARSAIRRA